MISPQARIEAFGTYVEARRAEIEATLDRVLPTPPVCPPRVAQAMRYGVTSGGKRLRPLLTLAAAETIASANVAGSAAALDEARRLAMPAACAVELIHNYSLIHDDLPAMDNDCLRRGRPTVHVIYGEALAILAGDGLLAEAFALLANEPNDRNRPEIAERKLQVLKRVGRALGAGGMLGGQAMDLEFEAGRSGRGGPVDVVAIEEMHARKTGSLIRAAAVSGAIMAGANAPQIAAIDRFAAELGLAFQIVDDVLDEESTSAVLGKTAGKDRSNGKVTYAATFGLAHSRAAAAACLERAKQALRASELTDARLLQIADQMIIRCC